MESLREVNWLENGRRLLVFITVDFCFLKLSNGKIVLVFCLLEEAYLLATEVVLGAVLVFGMNRAAPYRIQKPQLLGFEVSDTIDWQLTYLLLLLLVVGPRQRRTALRSVH